MELKFQLHILLNDLWTGQGLGFSCLVVNMAVVCCSMIQKASGKLILAQQLALFYRQTTEGPLWRCTINLKEKIYHIIHFKNKTLNLSLTMILRRNSVSKTRGMLDTVCLGGVGGFKRQRGKKKLTRGRTNKDESTKACDIREGTAMSKNNDTPRNKSFCTRSLMHRKNLGVTGQISAAFTEVTALKCCL